jgi:hypothetical protein
MRGLVIDRRTVEVKSFGSKLKGKNFVNPHYAYPNRCAPFGKNLILLKRGGFS